MSRSTEYYRESRDDRMSWRDSMPQRCMVCGWTMGKSIGPAVWLEVHEIQPRSQAAGRWAHHSNYLLTCNHCHANTLASMPHAEQLAIKLVKDADHFDLDAWLRIKDPELRAPDRVTMDDVNAHL